MPGVADGISSSQYLLSPLFPFVPIFPIFFRSFNQFVVLLPISEQCKGSLGLFRIPHGSLECLGVTQRSPSVPWCYLGFFMVPYCFILFPILSSVRVHQGVLVFHLGCISVPYGSLGFLRVPQVYNNFVTPFSEKL